MTVHKIEVSTLREGPVTLLVDQPCRDLDLNVEEFSFLGNVKGTIVFQIVQNEIVGRGEVRAMTRTRCVRCLKETNVELLAPVELVYLHDPGLPESEIQLDSETFIYNYYNGEFIEPIKDIRELILIELPTHPLCKQDCRGLCPSCGVNKNDKNCSCSTEETGSQADEDSLNWKAQLRAIRPASQEDRKKS
ncbi:MAG: DUF177 domain-containing protein [bacterium]